MEIVKFSELEDWTGKTVSEKGIDLSKFETTQGAKLQKLAQSYNIDLFSFEKRNYFKEDYRLPFENKLEQYRITLGKIWSLEDVEDEWRATDIEGFLKEWGNKRPDYEKDFLNDLKRIGNVEEVERQKLEFSIFLPEIKKNKNLLSLAIWQSAYLYFVILKNSTSKVYDGRMLEYYEAIHDEKLGHYFEISKFQVSNKNVSKVADYAYRLYKDSKFFHELREHMGDKIYENFINDLTNLK